MRGPGRSRAKYNNPQIYEMGKLDPWKLLRNPHTTSKHGPPRKGRKLSFRAMRGLSPRVHGPATEGSKVKHGRPRAANAVRLALLRVSESRRARCGRASQYARSGRRRPTTVDRRGGGLASQAQPPPGPRMLCGWRGRARLAVSRMGRISPTGARSTPV